eukprot:6281102-Pyramimonas_sp.AAC.1
MIRGSDRRGSSALADELTKRGHYCGALAQHRRVVSRQHRAARQHASISGLWALDVGLSIGWNVLQTHLSGHP